MTPRSLVSVCLTAAAACGGGTLMFTASSLSTVPPKDAYTCAADEAKKIGYRLRAHDDVDFRVVAERDNPNIKEPTGTYIRGFDRLEFTMEPDASGKTSVAVKAQSFKESVTARGNNLDEIKATSQAKADANSIMAACAAS